MPIRLNATEMAFVSRVQGYCAEGLTQSQMAAREGITLSGMRDKLRRCSLEFATRTEREIVRVKTGETLADLLRCGDLVGEQSEAVA
jgi:hypothetical protein